MHCPKQTPPQTTTTLLTFSFSDTAAAVAMDDPPLPSHMLLPSRTDPSSCLREVLQLLDTGDDEWLDCANGKRPVRRLLVQLCPRILFCAEFKSIARSAVFNAVMR
jgi:hypothetical protein